MKQSTYNIIVKCILFSSILLIALQYGAPALTEDLMQEFNQTVTNDNILVQQQIAEEQAKREAEAKAQADKTKTEQKVLNNQKK